MEVADTTNGNAARFSAVEEHRAWAFRALHVRVGSGAIAEAKTVKRIVCARFRRAGYCAGP
jgi:hypothetical protein